jgi:NAD(P)H dehydrogenase (quinone)
VQRLAEAVMAGAEGRGAEVRLRRVAEAHLDDLTWADGVAVGMPAPLRHPAAQLEQLIDDDGPLWAAGAFGTKPVMTFAWGTHGVAHWACMLVACGRTEQALLGCQGEPCRAALRAGQQLPDELPAEIEAAARHQGQRLADVTRGMCLRRWAA